MTLVEHVPVTRPFEHLRYARSESLPFVPQSHSAPQQEVIPVHTHYCAAGWTCGDATTTSTLIEGLTIGAVLGRLVELLLAFTATLGLGWLVRRFMRH